MSRWHSGPGAPPVAPAHTTAPNQGPFGDLPGKVNASAKELKMAEQLIDALSMEWNPEEFHDTFQEKVAALIEAKKAGESVEKAESPAKATGAVYGWTTERRRRYANDLGSDVTLVGVTARSNRQKAAAFL